MGRLETTHRERLDCSVLGSEVVFEVHSASEGAVLAELVERASGWGTGELTVDRSFDNRDSFVDFGTPQTITADGVKEDLNVKTATHLRVWVSAVQADLIVDVALNAFIPN